MKTVGITTERWRTCPTCFGIGSLRPTPDTKVQCPTCKGGRWVEVIKPAAPRAAVPPVSAKRSPSPVG